MDMNAVKNLYNHYLDKVKKQPNLYATGNFITVVLPAELKEYANAAAGTGVGDTHTPVGIRKSSNNPFKELSNIFSSIDNLAKFIASSECNAHLAVERAIARRGPKVDNRSADSAWSDIYAKYNVKDIAQRFGRDTVINARKTLTVNEFELRFGLALAA